MNLPSHSVSRVDEEITTKMQLPSLFSLFFFFLLFLPLQSQSQSQQERQTLLKIKDDWGNPTTLVSWEDPSSGPYCNWNGVTCIGDSVTGIVLRNQDLSYPIPPSICDLVNISTIDLNWNNIPGPFPTSLYNCSNLQYLDIAQNYFVGQLPSDIHRLSSLRYLHVYGNNFSGDIPPSIGRLSNLIDLQLHQNLFEGSVPATIADLSNLQILTLNDLSAMPAWHIPHEFGRLKNLKFLWIRQSNLIGEIPDSLTNLTELGHLDLSGNDLSGQIPANLFKLSKLKKVYLFSNRLTGEIPRPIEALGMEQLDLSMNQLNGSIPEDIAKLANMTHLLLYYNRLSGEIPASIGRMPSLAHVQLFNNSLSGVLPPELGMHSYLLNFEVSANRISGELPRNLCARGVLFGLAVFENNLNGTVPETLGNCQSLTTVQLYRNHLSGEIPAGFWTAENLTSVRINDNLLSGQLPEKLAWNLSRLDMSNNQFSGEIPARISESKFLTVFTASNNQFSGQIPKSLTELSQLQTLNLDSNRISGVIPPEISSWKSLNVLDLSNNMISGKIPPSIGSLPGLNSLSLSGNLLSGEIPLELGFLRLSELNLSSNRLSGKIPDGLDSAAYNSSFLNNTGLCTTNPLPNLSSCATSFSRDSAKISSQVLAAAGIVALVVVALFGFFAKDCIKRKQRKFYADLIVKRRKKNGAALESENRQFTYSEVVRMTDNFERSIGKGGFGTVYHGQLKDGTQVAVKMLSLQSLKSFTHSHQGSIEFQNEAHLLMRIHHKNLVPFVGYCDHENSMALIFTYMPEGNLGKQLSECSNEKMLCWNKRLRIALDVAQGLEYLHDCCSPPIIHRDVKTANILLNENLEAKIADFGLSKSFVREDMTHMSTAVKGTHGYLDPEYCISNKLTEKSDVYGFGVVLLQLVTGQPAIIRSSELDPMSIIEWVSHFVADRDMRCLVDQRMKEDYGINVISKAIEIAISCTLPRSNQRPTMRKVVAELKECLGIEDEIQRTNSLGVEDAIQRTSSLGREDEDIGSISSLYPLPR